VLLVGFRKLRPAAAYRCQWSILQLWLLLAVKGGSFKLIQAAGGTLPQQFQYYWPAVYASAVEIYHVSRFFVETQHCLSAVWWWHVEIVVLSGSATCSPCSPCNGESPYVFVTHVSVFGSAVLAVQHRIMLLSQERLLISAANCCFVTLCRL
jgi:hypothetical protein